MKHQVQKSVEPFSVTCQFQLKKSHLSHKGRKRQRTHDRAKYTTNFSTKRVPSQIEFNPFSNFRALSSKSGAETFYNGREIQFERFLAKKVEKNHKNDHRDLESIFKVYLRFVQNIINQNGCHARLAQSVERWTLNGVPGNLVDSGQNTPNFEFILN